MALAPKFAGHKYVPADGGTPSRTQHTLEIYLDYVCPFSAKMFSTLYNSVLPKAASEYPNLTVVFRHQIQPWHPSSTLTHESALAVLRLSPQSFWSYSSALFKKQREFYDIPCAKEGRNETYARLTKVAGTVGIDETKMLDLLRVPESGEGLQAWNVGNKVTDDLKQVIKAARVVGVHVSPTVFFNGIEERSISSSWTSEQWQEWLQKNAV